MSPTHSALHKIHIVGRINLCPREQFISDASEHLSKWEITPVYGQTGWSAHTSVMQGIHKLFNNTPGHENKSCFLKQELAREAQEKAEQPHSKATAEQQVRQ